MSSVALDAVSANLQEVVAGEVRSGLGASPKTLTPWLFYDEAGSQLFEAITALPEYYLTRTERALFVEHAAEIVALAADDRPLTMVELGAGTASKTGVLLAAALRRQPTVLYQPVDVSGSALAEAAETLETALPGVRVQAQVADYTAVPIAVERPPEARVLALYIGSSIGNFFPGDAVAVLRNLRRELREADTLLLGADLAPGEHKSVATLLAAYDDAAGVTAAFNRNLLVRLNRELGANFDPAHFAHVARWNAVDSRIEMHLESLRDQTVQIPAVGSHGTMVVHFRAGETIHTENSYKFTRAALHLLLGEAGFAIKQVWTDAAQLFAVTLAEVRRD